MMSTSSEVIKEEEKEINSRRGEAGPEREGESSHATFKDLLYCFIFFFLCRKILSYWYYQTLKTQRSTSV